MTKAEADALVREQGGDLCVSFRERADGSVVHRGEPVVPLTRLRARLPAAASFSLMLAACTPSAGSDAEPAPAQEPKAAEPKAEAPKAEAPTPKPEAEAPKAEHGEAAPKPETTPAIDEQRHVKGKWAPVEDTIEDPKTEAPDAEAGPPKPEPEPERPIRKGKWRPPEGD